jgi:hypothetical protein
MGTLSDENGRDSDKTLTRREEYEHGMSLDVHHQTNSMPATRPTTARTQSADTSLELDETGSG